MANKPPKQWANPNTGVVFYSLGVDPEVKQSQNGRSFQLRQWVAIGCRVCGGAFAVYMPQSRHPSLDSQAQLVTCPEHRGQLARDKLMAGQQAVLSLIKSTPSSSMRYSEVVRGMVPMPAPTTKRHIKRLKEAGLISVESGLLRASSQPPPTP